MRCNDESPTRFEANTYKDAQGVDSGNNQLTGTSETNFRFVFLIFFLIVFHCCGAAVCSSLLTVSIKMQIDLCLLFYL